MLFKKFPQFISGFLIFTVMFSQLAYPLTVQAEEKLEPPTPSENTGKGPGPGDFSSKMADTPTIQPTGANVNQSAPAQSVNLFQTDLLTGKASTTVPIGIPAGRAGMQPSLALTYTSSNENGIAGVGWNFGLGAIQRETKDGVPNYNDIDNFNVSFNGISGKLVRTSGLIVENPSNKYYKYRLENDPASLEFFFQSDTYWYARDNQGNIYYFGLRYNPSDVNGQSKLILPGNPSLAAAWYLDYVIDVNTNYYRAGYQLTEGQQILLTMVEYTGNAAQADQPKYQVQFVHERLDINGVNPQVSYRLGFKQEFNRRLNQVLVFYGSQKISKYQLNYIPSPQTGRSLLTKVNFISYNGDSEEELIRPVEFSYQNGSKSWSNSSSNVLSEDYWSMIDYRYSPLDQGIRFADINGDGLQDIVKLLGRDGTAGNPDPGWEASRGNYYAVWLQTRSGSWEYNTNWRNSLYNISVEANAVFAKNTNFYNNGDWGFRIVDVNADSKADLVLARQNWFAPGQTVVSTTGVWLNNGAGWTKDPDWAVPNIFISWTNSYYPNSGGNFYDQGMRLGDINGDGYVDLMVGRGGTGYQWGDASEYSVYLNKPKGNSRTWEKDSNWSNAYQTTALPFTWWWTGQRSMDEGVQLVDVNGDGLADLIRGLNDYSGGVYREVHLNNGSGWTRASYNLPAAFVGWSHMGWGYAALDQGMRLGDINGDGLVDLIKTYNSSGDQKVWLNTGQGWQLEGNWSAAIPQHFISWTGSSTYSYGTELLDINSDGVTDFVKGLNGGGQTWLNQSANADLLVKITNSLGGTSEIEYRSSAKYANLDNSQPNMPFTTPVVRSISNKSGRNNPDGSAHTYTTVYDYYNGKYDSAKKEFRGFGTVYVTNEQSDYTITKFAQDDIYKGKILEVKSMKGGSNKNWNTITNNWQAQPMFSLQRTYLESSTTDFTDVWHSGNNKQSKVSYEYDDHNNPTKTISYGDTNLSGDEKVVVSEYNYNTSQYLKSSLKRSSVYDRLNYDQTNLIKMSEYYYDGAEDTSTPPTKGQVSKQLILNKQGEHPTSRLEYDSYGNVIKGYDAKNIPMETEYDSTLHQYPVKVKQKVNDALTLETTNSYDLARGLLLSSTDANGQTSRTEYDSLGRVLKQYKSTDTSFPSIQYEYYLKDTGIPRVFQLTRLPDNNWQYLGTFYDGLGRTMFTYSQDPYGGRYDIISGQVNYDNLGRVITQYPSYFSEYGDDYRSAPAVPNATKNGRTEIEYDYMGRVYTTKIAPGTNDEIISWNEYIGWDVKAYLKKATESNYTAKIQNKYDAYQHLVEVNELNADGSVYSRTQYQYDAADNLVKVIDNNGNTTQLAYDTLGRKIFMSDPNMGSWQYFYDINGNLTKQIDAKNQTVEMQYDNLNRLTLKTTKDAQNTTQSTTKYYYDANPFDVTALYSKGKLTATESLDKNGHSQYQTIFWFDQLGREVKNEKRLNDQTYQIQKEYDSADRLSKVIQPENTNSQARDEIYYSYYNIGAIKTISGKENGQDKTYVASIEYNARGQKEKIVYGNNTATTYTYNPNNYLLNNLITTNASAQKLQDMAYQFDKAGNITKITDNLDNSRTENYQYDNLSRLTQAQGAYGTINYTYDQIGNLTNKNSLEYRYGENGAGPHALTSKNEGGETSIYQYDANGNMTSRNGNVLSYDSENHLISAEYQKATSSYTVHLDKGWNFISVPNEQTSYKIKDIFAGLECGIGKDYSQISRWNPETEQFENYIGEQGSQFTELEFGKGYEIYVEKADGIDITFSGNNNQTDTNKSTPFGWNIMGTTKSQTVQEFVVSEFSSHNTVYVYLYNQQTDKWQYQQANQTLSPGVGYAVFSKINDTRTIKPNIKQTTTFTYDENGGRIKKTSGNTTNIYLGPSFELEKTGTKTTVVESIFEGDNRIVSSNDGVDYWYHQNHLGSTDVMTDFAGQDAKTRVQYYPYGKTFKQTGDKNLTKYLYTGKELDNSTELYYYGARYYDPDLQRFTQADTIVPSPSDPQSFNRYSYAANNPIIYNDPSGHFAIPIIPILWGAVTGAAFGGISAAVTGGNIGQGMLTGAITGAIFGGIGGYGDILGLSQGTMTTLHFLGGMIAGGVNAAITGGNIVQGIITSGISTGVSKLLGTFVPGINSGFERMIIGALAGGITALAMGGDFVQNAKMGFVNSGVAYLGNDLHTLIYKYMSTCLQFTDAQEAYKYWTDKYAKTKNPFDLAMATVASSMTDVKGITGWSIALTIGGSYVFISGASGMVLWQYAPMWPVYLYGSRYATPGGNIRPYAPGKEAIQALKLPSYNTGSFPDKVPVRMLDFWAGPQKVPGGSGTQYVLIRNLNQFTRFIKDYFAKP